MTTAPRRSEVLAPSIDHGHTRYLNPDRMSQLTPSLADEVLAACRANAAEAAAALGRSLDGDFTLAVGEHAAYSPVEAPSGFDGPGLVVLLKVGGDGLAAVLPESTGLLPAWYRSPDPTGASKLSTLAQELSLLVMPEALLAEEFTAIAVDNLAAALAMTNPSADAALVTIELTSGSGTGQLSLIWPLTAPDLLLPSAAPSDAESNADSFMIVAPPPPPARPRDFSQLPSYSRSLLKIRVPVSVNLAAKKESVQEVVELVPGSIIKFEKGCDELLHMVVGGQMIAQGEAVKIGDKFGFRVTAMLMPEEHFIPVRRPRAS